MYLYSERPHREMIRHWFSYEKSPQQEIILTQKGSNMAASFSITMVSKYDKYYNTPQIAVKHHTM